MQNSQRFDGSPKREKMLGSIQENVEGEVDYEEHSRNKSSSLDKLCVTRWTVRAACFLKIINNYDQLLDLWEMCLNEKLTTDVKARIIGCNAQMRTFLFYFSLLLGHRIYALTDNLSKTLQKEKMSAVSGQRLANLTVQTFQSMRNNESFKLFFETVVKKAKQHSLIEEPTAPRKRNRPDYSILHHLDGYGQGASAYHATTIEEHYRQIYLEALDTMIASVKERFNQPSYKTFASLENLLLGVINNGPYEEEMPHLTNMGMMLIRVLL